MRDESRTGTIVRSAQRPPTWSGERATVGVDDLEDAWRETGKWASAPFQTRLGIGDCEGSDNDEKLHRRWRATAPD